MCFSRVGRASCPPCQASCLAHLRSWRVLFQPDVLGKMPKTAGGTPALPGKRTRLVGKKLD